MNKPLKILYLTPDNPHLKTPETSIAEYLAKRGHSVTLATGYSEEILKNTYDVVFGAMEVSMNAANYIGNRLNIPVYNHMEWVPVFRTKLEPQEDWGYDGTTNPKLSEEIIERLCEIYKQQVYDWDIADARTIAGSKFEKDFEKFGAINKSDGNKLYCADFDKLEKYRIDKPRKLNQICTIARLVPHKKVIHIVRALSKLKNPPRLVVIGYGEEYEFIKKEALERAVPIEFVGSGKEGVKEQIIQESLFCVYPCAGVPVAESLYFDKASIGYDIGHMREILGESIELVTNNDIDALANKIKQFLDDTEYRDNIAKKGKELMLCNKLRITTPDKVCEQIEEMLELAIKRFNEKNNVHTGN